MRYAFPLIHVHISFTYVVSFFCSHNMQQGLSQRGKVRHPPVSSVLSPFPRCDMTDCGCDYSNNILHYKPLPLTAWNIPPMFKLFWTMSCVLGCLSVVISTTISVSCEVSEHAFTSPNDEW